MAAKYFYCSNTKDKILISECLNKCDNRCLSLPTLMAIGEERKWFGKPSTTMCLQGTREAYLRIVEDYAIDPFDCAFMLLGTKHHMKLEEKAKLAGLIAEEKLDSEITGILDLLVEDGDGGYSLWDYKSSGSFAVARALGIKAITGTKGNPTTYEIKPEYVDMWDWEMQTNNYRVMIEERGLRVNNIYIQATVRDGGTLIAFNRGVDKKIYKIPVKRLEDDYVREYFKTKSTALLTALETKTMPLPCSNKENWYFRKCKEFCPVSEFCDVGIHQRGK